MPRKKHRDAVFDFMHRGSFVRFARGFLHSVQTLYVHNVVNITWLNSIRSLLLYLVNCFFVPGTRYFRALCSLITLAIETRETSAQSIDEKFEGSP